MVNKKSFQKWELFYLALFTLKKSKHKFRANRHSKTLKKVFMVVCVYLITIQRKNTLPIAQNV